MVSTGSGCALARGNSSSGGASVDVFALGPGVAVPLGALVALVDDAFTDPSRAGVAVNTSIYSLAGSAALADVSSSVSARIA